eukprot:CAMPEP_0172715822 /NCGR_PEP_ID=MMETSP1074-20121228/67767_1 /TAXON_ID=2916 /ORGANISM="Ceratium fusus, Strain PA161109" /LENGTH=453 /DNA_ID=CAMNT_0013540441 /DNA_START=50 /DNA_END=1411 /DNA_ORIENTATION=-
MREVWTLEAAGGSVRHPFVPDRIGNVHHFYDVVGSELGSGASGTVHQMRHRSSGTLYAAKTFLRKERCKKEVDILKVMDHPNIVRLHETFQDGHNTCLITELCHGGDLFTRIQEAGHLSEMQVAVVVPQLLRAVLYMHSNQVCHRDLKPENLLLATCGHVEEGRLRIADFGVARHFEPGQPLATCTGTAHFAAPEVLEGTYDEQCDLWSCGVNMYTMLCGHPPFLGESDAEVLASVCQGYFNFDEPVWESVSEDAKNLVKKLLHKNPRERYTSLQALSHRWIEKKQRAKKISMDSTLGLKIVANLRSYGTLNRVQQLTLSIIARQRSDSEVRQFQDTFLAFDKHGHGRLSFADLQDGLQRIGLKKEPPDLWQIMGDVAKHGDGCIAYTDFMAAMLDRRLCLKDEFCKWPFHALSPQTWKTSVATRRYRSNPCITDGDAGFEEFMRAVCRPAGC